jgi:hypothetical protein
MSNSKVEHVIVLTTSLSEIAIQATLLEFSSKIKTFLLEIETAKVCIIYLFDVIERRFITILV